MQQAAINGANGDRTALKIIDRFVIKGACLGIVIEMLRGIAVVGVVDEIVITAGIAPAGVDHDDVVQFGGKAVHPNDGGGVHPKIVVDLAVEAVFERAGDPGGNDDVAKAEIKRPAQADVGLEDVAIFRAGLAEIWIAGDDDAVARREGGEPDGAFADLADSMGELIRPEWRGVGIEAGELPELDAGAGEDKAVAPVFPGLGGAVDVVPDGFVFEIKGVAGIDERPRRRGGGRFVASAIRGKSEDCEKRDEVWKSRAQ